MRTEDRRDRSANRGRRRCFVSLSDHLDPLDRETATEFRNLTENRPTENSGAFRDCDDLMPAFKKTSPSADGMAHRAHTRIHAITCLLGPLRIPLRAMTVTKTFGHEEAEAAGDRSVGGAKTM